MKKSDVYRKAAEVIVRDGQYKGDLIGKPGTDAEDNDMPYSLPNVADRKYPVCALGACARAEYELYGTFSEDPYAYSFLVGDEGLDDTDKRPVWGINDDRDSSAEDIALLFKSEAEKLDSA